MKTAIFVAVMCWSVTAIAKPIKKAAVSRAVTHDCSLDTPPPEIVSSVNEIVSAMTDDASWKKETDKLLARGKDFAVCAVRVAWNRGVQPKIEAAKMTPARPPGTRLIVVADVEKMRKRAGTFITTNKPPGAKY